MDPKVAIIILNWNGWKDTIECLESLSKITYSNYWVIVVDNGSKDDSIAELKEYCQGGNPVGTQLVTYNPSSKPISILEYAREDAIAGGGNEGRVAGVEPNRRLVLIRNENNYGFAQGNNIGIEYAIKTLDPEYLMLLNNDTVVTPDFLTELVRYGETDERIGVLGPKMYFYDYDGRRDVILYAGGEIIWWREIVYKHIGAFEVDIGQFDVNNDTEWCSGAAMMIRCSLANRFLLNARYLFGNEDAEYCMQARKNGMRVVYVFRSKVWHKTAASRGKLGKSIRRDIPSYFSFIRDNFSFPIYTYHIFLFVLVVIPKWFLMYVAFHRDRETLGKFLSEIKKLLA